MITQEQVVEAIIADDETMLDELARSSNPSALREQVKTATSAAMLLRRQMGPNDPEVSKMVLARLLPRETEDQRDPNVALRHAMRRPNERVQSRGDHDMSTLSTRRADPQFGVVVTRAGVPSGLDLAALPEPLADAVRRYADRLAEADRMRARGAELDAAVRAARTADQGR